MMLLFGGGGTLPGDKFYVASIDLESHTTRQFGILGCAMLKFAMVSTFQEFLDDRTEGPTVLLRFPPSNKLIRRMTRFIRTGHS